MHDIGHLGMLWAFPEYEKAMIEASANGQNLLTAERELFGLDHAEAGRWLLSQWGCPIELQNTAAFHHNPPLKPDCDRELIRLVSACSQAADLMGMSVFPPASPVDLADAASSLPPDARRELVEGYPGIAEWVFLTVNEIELKLL